MSLPLLLSIHNIKLLNVSLLHISEAQNSSIVSYFQPRLSVEWNAFEDSSSQGKEASLSWNRIPVNGTVTIKNTVEAFKVPLVFLFGCSSFAGVLVVVLVVVAVEVIVIIANFSPMIPIMLLRLRIRRRLYNKRAPDCGNIFCKIAGEKTLIDLYGK